MGNGYYCWMDGLAFGIRERYKDREMDGDGWMGGWV